MINNPLGILNLGVLLQQQRYIIAISYLFYLQNGLNLSDFLLFQSVFYFTGLFAEIPAGYIGDIFPKKNVLIFSYMLFIVRIVMWIVMPNYYTILLGEILYGLSKAFYRGVSDGYIYEYLKTENATNLMLAKYGKFNFFMSCGSAISCLIGAWLYQYVGFTVLLFIELFCNTLAVGTIFLLPQLPHTKRSNSFTEHIGRIFDIVKTAVSDSRINLYMLLGGILSGITSVIVWNFQPYMKSFALPVVLFGVIYFINHILRALGSINAKNVISKISLVKTTHIIWLLYIICFAAMSISLGYKSYYICIAVLMFICISIGIQMVFNVGNLSRIHDLIPSESRATISSVNSMLISLFSGLFLMFNKVLVHRYPLNIAIIVCLILFIPAFVLILKITKSEQKM